MVQPGGQAVGHLGGVRSSGKAARLHGQTPVLASRAACLIIRPPVKTLVKLEEQRPMPRSFLGEPRSVKPVISEAAEVLPT